MTWSLVARPTVIKAVSQVLRKTTLQNGTTFVLPKTCGVRWVDLESNNTEVLFSVLRSIRWMKKHLDIHVHLSKVAYGTERNLSAIAGHKPW